MKKNQSYTAEFRAEAVKLVTELQAQPPGCQGVAARYAFVKATLDEGGRPPRGLIHPSDRGSQHCAHGYRKLVKSLGMPAPMSRRGN